VAIVPSVVPSVLSAVPSVASRFTGLGGVDGACERAFPATRIDNEDIARKCAIFCLVDSMSGAEYIDLTPLAPVTLGPLTRDIQVPSFAPPFFCTGLIVPLWPHVVVKTDIVKFRVHRMVYSL
jgi:hypothetical protein